MQFTAYAGWHISKSYFLTPQLSLKRKRAEIGEDEEEAAASKMEIPASKGELLAAVDMGTNSFKLHLVRTGHPTGRFLPLPPIKHPVLLPIPAPPISAAAQARALSALADFARILRRNSVTRFSVVATSAVREAGNSAEFLSRVRDEVGFHVKVLSGEDEARLIYLGILQCLPIFDATALTVDIGGGSTEIALAKGGNLMVARSLKLGHLNLTENFVNSGDVAGMRRFIRSEVEKSGLMEKVREIGFDVAVGSSGTIKSIGRAVAAPDNGRTGRITREGLGEVMGELCGGKAAAMRLGVPKRRAEFIHAGAVLLWEVFEKLGIAEMEVSEYALGEGVVAEMMMAEASEAFHSMPTLVHGGVPCSSPLAQMFESDKQMESDVNCMDTTKVEGFPKI